MEHLAEWGGFNSLSGPINSSQPQRGAFGNRLKIPILGEQRYLISQTKLGDQAIDRRANGKTLAATQPVDAGGCHIVRMLRFQQPIKCIKQIGNTLGLRVSFETQKDFGQHHTRHDNTLAICNGGGQTICSR